MAILKDFTRFKDRKERADFIVEHFKKNIDDSQSILDVGCDDNVLKNLIGPKVTGIDLYGTPDYTVNLESELLSRFTDNQFDLVVCTEVLEHLEKFHMMVDELLRVARKQVLISLPNCFDLYTKYNIVFNNKAGKYYGLPLSVPEDRHRWIFGWQTLDTFFKDYCQKNNLVLSENFLNFNFPSTFKGNLAKILIKTFNIHSASQSYWILISKR
jgi:predicted SAM-dependent methyltransferase